MPNALLARYFQARGLFGDLDFSAMKETQRDELFAAWLDLPDSQRNEMDAEFRDVFELSCERGFRAIIDEAEWHLTTDSDARTGFVENLAALSNHYERAMVTFLDHGRLWKGATRFYHADTLPYWRKRKNLPHVRAAPDDTSLQELASLIRSYFHHTEGRGNNCVVEPFRRGALDYFFAYPEDYSEHSIERVNGTFGCRPHNPAFEVIYVYSQREGSLDLNFRGSHKAIEPLQGMFTTAILKLAELPPDPQDERVYDLNPLRQKGFDFVFNIDSGVQYVAVRKLRLSSKVKKGDRITLEADTTNNPDAVYPQRVIRYPITGEVQGVFPEAFELRVTKNEPYLSVHWMEYFSADIDHQFQKVVNALRKKRDVVPNSAIARLNAGLIVRAGSLRGYSLRIRDCSSTSDPGYSGIYGLPRDNLDAELLALLATECCIQVRVVRDIEAT
jgi:hypothetical protein